MTHFSTILAVSQLLLVWFWTCRYNPPWRSFWALRNCQLGGKWHRFYHKHPPLKNSVHVTQAYATLMFDTFQMNFQIATLVFWYTSGDQVTLTPTILAHVNDNKNNLQCRHIDCMSQSHLMSCHFCSRDPLSYSEKRRVSPKWGSPMPPAPSLHFFAEESWQFAYLISFGEIYTHTMPLRWLFTLFQELLQ